MATPKDKADTKHDGAPALATASASASSKPTSSAAADDKAQADKLKKAQTKVKKPAFGGKPGPKGGRGKGHKKKRDVKPPSWHVDNIPKQVLTKMARQGGCGRVSESGKLALANVYGRILIDLMKIAEKYSRACGRKKTIEFGDVVHAASYFPVLKKLLMPNKKYKGKDTKEPEITYTATKRRAKSSSGKSKK